MEVGAEDSIRRIQGFTMVNFQRPRLAAARLAGARCGLLAVLLALWYAGKAKPALPFAGKAGLWVGLVP
jgi:hypothetical protein